MFFFSVKTLQSVTQSSNENGFPTTFNIRVVFEYAGYQIKTIIIKICFSEFKYREETNRNILESCQNELCLSTKEESRVHAKTQIILNLDNLKVLS